MTRPPAYLSDKIEYLTYARAHRKNPPPGCMCHLCMTTAEFTAMIGERIEVNTRRIGEAPF